MKSLKEKKINDTLVRLVLVFYESSPRTRFHEIHL